MNLRSWLKKTPRPVFVLADEKRIDVPNNHRAINDLVATIEALEPAKVTCLDKDGNVIRSMSLESEDDRSVAPATPEQSDLQLFARLLAEGYEHGRKANQPIIDSAMQFVERQGVRLAKAEAEIERLRAHIHKQNLSIAEMSVAPEPAADGTIMDALVQGAIQAGVLQQQPKPPTPIKSGVKP